MHESQPAGHAVGGGEAPRTRLKDVHLIMNAMQQRLAADGLVRPHQGRVLGGVCAGLGRRFGLRPWPARLLFMLLLMIIPGSQLLIYPVLWLLMPSEETNTFHQVTPTTST